MIHFRLICILSKPIWTNYAFLIAILFLLGSSMGIIFASADWMDAVFEFTYPYWTSEMNPTDDPLHLESIPKLGDENYPHVRIM